MPLVNESVWLDQVDKALKTYIPSVVTSPKNGEPISAKTRKPDEDFKTEEYPRITFFNLNITSDNMRRGSYRQEVLISKDYENYTGLMDEAAEPYNLFYQIDFWAGLQSHINDMTRQWLAKNKRFFNLDVLDMSDNPRNSLALQQGNLQHANLFNGSQRIFHSFLTYRIQVELDESTPYEIPLVREVILKNKSNRR